MKEKVKLAILLFFITFLSFLNLKNGLVFKTTDNTERDATLSLSSVEVTKKENIKQNLASVNIPAAASTAQKTAPKTTQKTTTSSTSRCIDYSKVLGTISFNGKNITVVEGCKMSNGQLDTPDRAGYAAKYGSLIYAHNTSSAFLAVKNKSVKSFTYKGITYNLSGNYTTPTRAQANSNMNTYVNSYPSIYLMTCSGTSYGNGDASNRTVAKFVKSVK